MPSVAEIAALSRRLRELSAQGRDADPTERAAFLADKDALLARIALARDADTYVGAEETAEQRHDHRVPPNRIAPADTDLPPETMIGREPGARPSMPPWMREQAARHEAEVAAGTAAALRADDTAELQARIEELRERIAARSAGLPEAAEIARREQLTSWHDDDSTDHYAHGDDADVQTRDDVAGDQGWSR